MYLSFSFFTVFITINGSKHLINKTISGANTVTLLIQIIKKHLQSWLGFELCKQQYIVSDTFWLQSLGTIWNGSLANAKIYLLLCSFRFFEFWIWGQFPSTSPQGLVFGGAIYWRVFCVMSLGGLYLKGLIFGILRYLDTCGKSLIVMIRCSSYLVY